MRNSTPRSVAVLSQLRMRSWHLKPATLVPSASEAFAAIQPIFLDTAFNTNPPYLDFDGTAPGISGDALILNNGLIYLRVEIEEEDACQKKRILR